MARFALLALLLTTAITASITAPGAQAHVLRFNRPAAPDASNAGSWVGPGGVVTENAVSGLIQVLQQDPQAAALLAQATQFAQNTIHDSLWKAISLCPSGINSDIQGQTYRGSAKYFPQVRDLEETAVDLLPNGSTNASAANQYYKDKINQLRAGAGIPASAPYDMFYLPDILVLKSMQQAPGICIDKNLSVSDAAAVLDHEMVHYIASDWSRWHRMEAFSGERDYELKTILEPGDEVDAYITQWGYEIRRSGKQLLPQVLWRFFGDDGSFIPKDSQGNDNRTALARLILSGGGLFLGDANYHSIRFVNEYSTYLHDEENMEAVLGEMLDELGQVRQENTDYYQVEAQNAEADSPGSADAKEADALVLEDQKSIQRIPQEEQSCSSRVATLNALDNANGSSSE